jgi:transposase
LSKRSIADYFPFKRVKVVDQKVDSESRITTIRIDPDGRYKPICHACGSFSSGTHSIEYRFIRDLDVASATNWLSVKYRKIRCEYCQGVRVEELSFCDPAKRITHRMARYVYELCKVLPIADVAKQVGLDPKTIREIDYRHLEQEYGRTDYAGLRVLAVDEIAIRKGHRYMTVVLDYLTGRVVWIGEGRDMDALDRFFAGMSEDEKAGIEAVAMDMWEPYINRFQHHCPKAKIVFDLFHLVKAFSDVIDDVRRSEYAKATVAQKPLIKGSRYLLFRNKENLTPAQNERLGELLRVNQVLCAVYILKDHLKTIYTATTRVTASSALRLWCAMAGQLEHHSVRRFIGRLRYFQNGILNHCKYKIGTSKLEGINNKIKVIKRRAYGFHDNHYFGLKIKQAFPGKHISNFSG